MDGPSQFYSIGSCSCSVRRLAEGVAVPQKESLRLSGHSLLRSPNEGTDNGGAAMRGLGHEIAFDRNCLAVFLDSEVPERCLDVTVGAIGRFKDDTHFRKLRPFCNVHDAVFEHARDGVDRAEIASQTALHVHGRTNARKRLRKEKFSNGDNLLRVSCAAESRGMQRRIGSARHFVAHRTPGLAAAQRPDHTPSPRSRRGRRRYLRELRRRYGVAVLVVHYARKGAGNARAGQALRGSSEFHAWGDFNLYLCRDGDDLTLTVEHRAAPSLTPIVIALAQRGPALALEVVAPPDSAAPAASGQGPLDECIAAALANIAGAMRFAELGQELPRPRRRLVRAPRRPHCRRPRRQNRRRVPPRRQLTATPPTIRTRLAPSAEFPVPLPGIPTAGTGTGKFGQAGIAVSHACPSNALHTSPSNCVIALIRFSRYCTQGFPNTSWDLQLTY